MFRDLRLAIVGCGAVVEQSHAPALRKLNWTPSLLIDPSAERRRAVRRLFSGAIAECEDLKSTPTAFDAALVAVPHAFHAPICKLLLSDNKHVLIEKPLAAKAEETAEITSAIRASEGKLAVALMRRQTKASRWLKSALDAKAFGRVHRFKIREGYEYNWPLTTDSMWRLRQAGGGVLIDTGAHTLDQVVWWFGEPEHVDYFDDSAGGVEADCLIRMTWDSGLEGEIELSRTRRLSNTVSIFTDAGSLTVACLGNEIEGDPAALKHCAAEIGSPQFGLQSVDKIFQAQLKEFAAYARGDVANVVTADEAALSVALIERCYTLRQRLNLPWLPYPIEAN